MYGMRGVARCMGCGGSISVATATKLRLVMTTGDVTVTDLVLGEDVTVTDLVLGEDVMVTDLVFGEESTSP